MLEYLSEEKKTEYEKNIENRLLKILDVHPNRRKGLIYKFKKRFKMDFSDYGFKIRGVSFGSIEIYLSYHPTDSMLEPNHPYTKFLKNFDHALLILINFLYTNHTLLDNICFRYDIENEEELNEFIEILDDAILKII